MIEKQPSDTWALTDYEDSLLIKYWDFLWFRGIYLGLCHCEHCLIPHMEVTSMIYGAHSCHSED